MATKTQTETKKEIQRKGDVVIVKETETTTIYAPGKEPEVKEITRVEEFKGEEGFKRLPEDVRRQLMLPAPKKDGKEPVAQSSNTVTKGDFVKESLEEHNKIRKNHGVDPLKLTQELLIESQKRAEELASKDELTGRTDHRFGENVSCLWSSDPDHVISAIEIVNKWYSEGKDYNFDEEPKNLNSGHFTQMVWKSCKEFGVGAAKSNSNKIYVVATYSPPGNFIGEFKNNVQPLGSKGKKMSVEQKETAKDSKKGGEATTSATNESLNEECVRVHNEYRALHGVPPLVFSKEVADYAQEWANYLADKDKFQHRSSRKYGENLYSFSSSDPTVLATAADACKSWYDEIKKHTFNAEPKNLKTGHFTQMVWKTTKEVGMGRATSKKGMQIIVANYNPPGNLQGTYKENVPPPTK